MLGALTVNTPTVIAILGIMAAPIIGYLAAARKMSGKIGTSEATDLWAESKAIRDDYRDARVSDQLRTADLEKRVASLEKDNNLLSRENIELSRKILEYETTISALTTTIHGLESTISDQDTRLRAIETQNSDLLALVKSLQQQLVVSREKEA